MPVARRLSQCLLFLSLCLTPSLRAADRITQAVDNGWRVALPGHISPRLKSAVDEGRVDPSMTLPYVTMVLKPSPGQQAGLDRLLAQQQDPASPNYHRWLRLSATARCVYGVLARYAYQGTTVKIGQRRIARYLGIHVETVNLAIHELEDRQHIASRGSGKSRRIYHLCSNVFGQKQRAGIEEVISSPSLTPRLASVRID